MNVNFNFFQSLRLPRYSPGAPSFHVDTIIFAFSRASFPQTPAPPITIPVAVYFLFFYFAVKTSAMSSSYSRPGPRPHPDSAQSRP